MSHENKQSFVQSIVYNLRRKKHHQKTVKMAIVTFLVGVIIGGGITYHATWLYCDGIQPITTEQRAILTDLVSQVASREGKSSKKVWEDLKQYFGVRRIDNILRRDMDHAIDFLVRRAAR